jgi:hypothetical protein
MPKSFEWDKETRRHHAHGRPEGRPRRKLEPVEMCCVCDEGIFFLDDYVMYASGYAHQVCRDFIALQKHLILGGKD